MPIGPAELSGKPGTSSGVFVEADLSVAATANALSLHPNSLRYRLGRITELTGRDPRKITDLLELIAATQVLTRQNGHDA